MITVYDVLELFVISQCPRCSAESVIQKIRMSLIRVCQNLVERCQACFYVPSAPNPNLNQLGTTGAQFNCFQKVRDFKLIRNAFGTRGEKTPVAVVIKD